MNLLGFSLFGFGQSDNHEPVLVFRAYPVVVDFDRQRDGSYELATRPLLAMEHFGLDVARRTLFFSRNSQRVMHDGQVERGRIEPGRDPLDVEIVFVPVKN